ncbi:MAG TPA: hypothetical protein DG414_03935 [Gammaproteobacteria bacterium]|jgi:hypothetical protein|nr:hypothetical protein [Gammaproteobacteria bacterium]|tara:strand:- start:2231 stop:2650 length:420 start_codon:yes stop_codon:yes gene_type:complete
MSKLTPKQERFAQSCVETLGALSLSYRDAYDADNMSDEAVKVEAWRLAHLHAGVGARIEQLQEKAARRHGVTMDSISVELDENRMMALEERAPAAAVQATMGKAKLHGLLVDKKEVTTPQGISFNMLAPNAEKPADPTD